MDKNILNLNLINFSIIKCNLFIYPFRKRLMFKIRVIFRDLTGLRMIMPTQRVKSKSSLSLSLSLYLSKSRCSI